MRDKSLCIVAPIFYEIAHVIVRSDSPYQSISDLQGQPVAIGPPKSGSRSTAKMIFESLELDCREVEVRGWSELNRPSAPDAAVICVRAKSRLVSELINSRQWRLLSIPDADHVCQRHPTLRTMKISPEDYPKAQLDGNVDTVRTTCFLVARYDAAGDLIDATLDAIYSSPPIITNLIPPESAAETLKKMDCHPATEAFFEKFEQP